MAERIEQDATGQATIVGEPDLPDLWSLERLAWRDLDPLWAPWQARIRAELRDPRRLVMIASVTS